MAMKMWESKTLIIWIIFVFINSSCIKQSLAQYDSASEAENAANYKYDNCLETHNIPYGGDCNLDNINKFSDEWPQDKPKNNDYEEAFAKLKCYRGSCITESGPGKCSKCTEDTCEQQQALVDCGPDFDNIKKKSAEHLAFSASVNEFEECMKFLTIPEGGTCPNYDPNYGEPELQRHGINCKGHFWDCYAKISLRVHKIFFKRRCAPYLYCEDAICLGIKGEKDPAPKLPQAPGDGCASKLAEVVKKYNVAVVRLVGSPVTPGTSTGDPPTDIPNGTPSSPGSGHKSNSVSLHLYFQVCFIVPVFVVAAGVNSKFLLV